MDEYEDSGGHNKKSLPISQEPRKEKNETTSAKASVTVSYVSKASTSGQASPSVLKRSSISPSVSVTPVLSSKDKSQSRPNVITSVGERSGSAVNNTASSLNELTISSASPSHLSGDSSEKPASTAVSVITRVTHGSPSVSLEAVTFKTPSPMRPLRTCRSSTDNQKPSVSVSVVKSVQSMRPETVTSPSASNAQKRAFKVASFAKASSSSSKVDSPNSVSVICTHSSSHQSSSDSPESSLDSPFSVITKRRNNSLTDLPQESLTNMSSSSVMFLPLSPSTASGIVRIKSPHHPTSSTPGSSHVSLHSVASDSSTATCSTKNAASDDEEEILVYMSFDAQLESDLLQSETAFKMIGVDSEKPVLQLGNQIFQGEWHDTMGTAVFFEEDYGSSLSGDPVFTKTPEHCLKYHSKTRKALNMSRIFIKPKGQEGNFLTEIENVPVEEILEAENSPAIPLSIPVQEGL